MEETTNKPSWEEKEQLIEKYIKEHQELAHAYFEPSGKDYWSGIEFSTEFLRIALSAVLTQREQEIESGIKKLTVVTYVGKGGIQYDRVLLDEVLTLLKKESNNNTKE